MTQNEKQLLLKDLCARLPYGVKIHAEVDGKVFGDEELQIVNKSAILGDYGPVPVINPVEDDTNDGFELTNVKPYLRPMSSMTEEEREEFRKVGGVMSHNLQNDHYAISAFTPEAYDWLNENMFDYRGVIPTGLALEAPEGMYKKE